MKIRRLRADIRDKACNREGSYRKSIYNVCRVGIQREILKSAFPRALAALRLFTDQRYLKVAFRM
jgi:hypothetical protein